ncbi:TRAP transporter small permease [Bradyrhizobium sp. 147]|jgi:TRAP-type C4-dicarboxylate transport system permease small subunit|uniref:TRAP transporter small permease n=1 Tax=unclassified Bradyrhizobium TaxID=2631580 RepID=UPI001FFA6197|nr:MULTISPECIES: TRAP transporter small permease [unclassified Bradyrhizobium]MCK1545145.1 TRAP transporter small permease [Bradyrhizobium sp. 179]MCK1626551.1 TRAP transporter small permease [Bradyrhizobium sp. 160]MCK1679164.1 TRAP transporter small permease [Bradyrhizobium sp. 147]
MAKVLDAYCEVLKAAVAVCLAAMVVLVFSNVVLRYIFNSGIAVSEELSRWLLVWLTFLGAIVALRQHAHLGVDTLVRALPPRGRILCFVVSYLLMLYADWLLTLGSWKQAVLTFGDTAPASGISVGLFFYSSGLVFGVSAATILAYDLFQVVTGAASGEDLIAVKESDGHS